jgi:hypothetical protein
MADRPPAHVGLGKPRSPRSRLVAPGGALASIWAAVSGHGAKLAETDDRTKAKRSVRLAALKDLQAPPDIWLDLQAIFTEAFDETLQAVMRKEIDPDALLATANILEVFDKNLAQGRAAMERLALRRVHGAVAAHGAADKPDRTGDDGMTM